MPTFNISNDDLNDLRSAMDAARPIHDRIASGDTSLSQSEMATYDRAFTKWQDVISSA